LTLNSKPSEMAKKNLPRGIVVCRAISQSSF
jgi:hypothetical protein